MIQELLSNLAKDTTHKGFVVECPELRLWPTLPPAAAIATARSFDDLEDVSNKFVLLRETQTHTMHTVATVLDRDLHVDSKRTRKSKRTVPQAGVAASNKPHQLPMPPPPPPPPRVTVMNTHTFLRCILEVTDPSLQLLSPEDAEKCLHTFLQRASSLLIRDRQNIASTYVTFLKNRNRGSASTVTVTIDDVLESLRDPDAALSDEGLHDAAIMMLSSLLRVTVVVSLGSLSDGRAPSTFCPNPSIPSSQTDAAVLIVWDPEKKRHSICGAVANLQAVRNKLMQMEGQSIIRDTSKLHKMTVEELQSVAARVAMLTPKQHFPTKTTIVDALSAIIAGNF